MFTSLPKTALAKLKTKRIYSIEGNIGAGKTTILKIIGKNFSDVTFVEEPVSQWQNLGGMNLLEMFYQDPERWGFSFELYVMLSKLKALAKAAESDKDIIILERSWFANKIFMDISFKLGKLNDLEYHMLLDIYSFFIKNVYPLLNGIVYWDTPVDVCIERMCKRNRDGESSVSKEYWTLLKQEFDELENVTPVEVLRINGDYDLARDSRKVTKNISEFMHPGSEGESVSTDE